jgi:hypothetical protein
VSDGLNLAEKRIIDCAIQNNLMTESEYFRRFHRRYICSHGSDSFIQYLDYVIINKFSTSHSGDISAFVTLNDKILRDRKKLEEKFKLKIVRPDEV